ncbi:unnamed protein product [Trypanosoma congolense IL3000]|uniref:WGS project CAEQ00000000 data, annotated contig 885 n=1 Tax=Trypanosoma congolense (strain IL3000) TaxID=1068625 RepID=F9WJ84_TRYCI|nr:unnamed protein product [Trypanosoma congolense IL3000]
MQSDLQPVAGRIKIHKAQTEELQNASMDLQATVDTMDSKKVHRAKLTGMAGKIQSSIDRLDLPTSQPWQSRETLRLSCGHLPLAFNKEKQLGKATPFVRKVCICNATPDSADCKREEKRKNTSVFYTLHSLMAELIGSNTFYVFFHPKSQSVQRDSTVVAVLFPDMHFISNIFLQFYSFSKVTHPRYGHNQNSTKPLQGAELTLTKVHTSLCSFFPISSKDCKVTTRFFKVPLI